MSSGNDSLSAAKCFKIPNSITPFISSMCPNGTFLVCRICSLWDVDGTKFGKVFLKNKYWLGYFKGHLSSTRHKKNCVRKSRFEEANFRRQERGERQQKRLKQTVLSFAPKSPNTSQVRDRIAGGVCPLIANNDISEEEAAISRVYEMSSSNNDVCQGIISKKDLENKSVQGGIKFIMKYCNMSTESSLHYKFMIVHGPDSVWSIFCSICKKSTEKVR